MSVPFSWTTKWIALAISGVVATTTACMHAPDRAEGYGTAAPTRELTAQDVPVNGHRVWIRLDTGERLVGELLAAESEGSVVVRTKREGVQDRPFATIKRAKVLTDEKAKIWLGSIAGATAVAIPVTLATGMLFVYLMPIVAVGGSVAFTVAWLESRVILRDDELQYLHQYARWPQGLPGPALAPANDDAVGVPLGP